MLVVMRETNPAKGIVCMFSCIIWCGMQYILCGQIWSAQKRMVYQIDCKSMYYVILFV